MQHCFFEENEKENLGEICEHNLQNDVEVPVKLCIEPLFLLLNVPELDKDSYLKIEQDKKLVSLQLAGIRVSIEGEQRQNDCIRHKKAVDIKLKF